MTTGEIGCFYEQQGGPTGALGYPTGDRQEDGAEFYQTFENGYVSHVPGREPIFVPNEVRKRSGGLGAATSPVRPLDAGRDYVQFFEAGMITVVDGVAECWVRSDRRSRDRPPLP